MDKNKKNTASAIYDDSISSGALLKDIKKKLDKKASVDIDTFSIEEKTSRVIKNLDSENKKIEMKNERNKIVKSNEQKKNNVIYSIF